MAVARGKIAISGIDDGEKRARDGVLWLGCGAADAHGSPRICVTVRALSSPLLSSPLCSRRTASVEPGESDRTLSLCLISMRNTDRRYAIVFSYPRAFFFSLSFSLSLEPERFHVCARVCGSRARLTRNRAVFKPWPRFHARILKN